jgi:hypothetical protein
MLTTELPSCGSAELFNHNSGVALRPGSNKAHALGNTSALSKKKTTFPEPITNGLRVLYLFSVLSYYPYYTNLKYIIRPVVF